MRLRNRVWSLVDNMNALELDIYLFLTTFDTLFKVHSLKQKKIFHILVNRDNNSVEL